MINVIDTIAGTWFLLYSNFPKWKKETVHDITYNYTPVQRDGERAMYDEVKYIEDNKPGSYKGYDYADEADIYKFKWRGNGLLFFVTAPWRIEWVSNDRTCAVVSFQKTLVSPAGVDIICRNKTTGSEAVTAALDFIERHPAIKQLAKGLFTVK